MGLAAVNTYIAMAAEAAELNKEPSNPAEVPRLSAAYAPLCKAIGTAPIFRDANRKAAFVEELVGMLEPQHRERKGDTWCPVYFINRKLRRTISAVMRRHNRKWKKGERMNDQPYLYATVSGGDTGTSNRSTGVKQCKTSTPNRRNLGSDIDGVKEELAAETSPSDPADVRTYPGQKDPGFQGPYPKESSGRVIPTKVTFPS